MWGYQLLKYNFYFSKISQSNQENKNFFYYHKFTFLPFSIQKLHQNTKPHLSGGMIYYNPYIFESVHYYNLCLGADCYNLYLGTYYGSFQTYNKPTKYLYCIEQLQKWKMLEFMS